MAAMRAAVDSGPAITPASCAQSRRESAAAEAAVLAAIDLELGESGTVVLVSCGKSKLGHAAPARELYTSPLFRKARELAERSGQPWAILSAEHGLVDPEQILDPYQHTLGDKDAAGRLAWGRGVAAEIARRWRGRATRFVVLAGAAYLEGLGELDLELPLAGLQVGERLRRMNQLLAGEGLAA